MTHIDRPVERQRHIFKHCAVLPAIAGLGPEDRMRDRVHRLPVPVADAPEFASRIPARGPELEILPIRHLVLIDLERRHLRGVRLEFVVPTESLAPWEA